ncbi:hypothetical protein C8R45DRAFT_1223466, partial [Mycena sanguinolenta]
MFSSAQRFTVTGQTFTNITNNYTTASNIPSDLRMFPLGDIDLRHEIRLHNFTGTANHDHERGNCVRRIYSARVEGRKASLTVAIYSGNDAEEEWRQEIAKYMTIRHSNIIQVFGTASSGGVYATLFNDDLIPLRHFLDGYRCSHFSTVYIYASCDKDFTVRNVDLGAQFLTMLQEAQNYIYSALQKTLWPAQCTNWMRRSTGRLCAELTEPTDTLWLDREQSESPGLLGVDALSTPSEVLESSVLDSLTLKQYHTICYLHLPQLRPVAISACIAVNLTTVFYHSPGDLPEHLADLASFSWMSYPGPWLVSEKSQGEVITNGWTRFQSYHVLDKRVSCSVFSCFAPDAWLSQANHIFHCLNIVSDFEDYFSLDSVKFQLTMLRNPRHPPAGFLFLCPEDNLRVGPSSFCWPSFVGYWSLDPTGAERLSPEDATRLGFPPFRLDTIAFGLSYEPSVYEGLRRFHQANGFDPESQGLARHLGVPRYQLSSRADAPFAHVTMASEDADADIDSDCARLELTSGEDAGEPRAVHGNMPEPELPWSLRFLINSQITLILFVALSSVILALTTSSFPPRSMDDRFCPDPAFTHSTTCDRESPSPDSGMFSRSRNFTVTGKNLTNITNNYTTAPSLPADFRMIPMGDIDLRRQIRVDEYTSVANCQRQRACVRRVHSAKARIDGGETRVTVAVYQGNGAQKEWRRSIAKYMSMRHPGIIQICGAASSNGLYATLFNDDLIPLRHFLYH